MFEVATNPGVLCRKGGGSDILFDTNPASLYRVHRPGFPLPSAHTWFIVVSPPPSLFHFPQPLYASIHTLMVSVCLFLSSCVFVCAYVLAVRQFASICLFSQSEYKCIVVQKESE